MTGSRPPSAIVDGPRAHQRHRVEDALHRPLAQRGVAVEGRRDRAARHRPHDQPAAGAGIAEIEHAARARGSRRPRRRARAIRPRRCARRWRPSARMALPVLSTSSPSSRPEIRVSPTASAPKISARWEIDLSPGTRSAALERPPAAGGSSGTDGGVAHMRALAEDESATSYHARAAGRHHRQPGTGPRSPLLTAAFRLAK